MRGTWVQYTFDVRISWLNWAIHPWNLYFEVNHTDCMITTQILDTNDSSTWSVPLVSLYDSCMHSCIHHVISPFKCNIRFTFPEIYDQLLCFHHSNPCFSWILIHKNNIADEIHQFAIRVLKEDKRITEYD